MLPGAAGWIDPERLVPQPARMFDQRLLARPNRLPAADERVPRRAEIENRDHRLLAQVLEAGSEEQRQVDAGPAAAALPGVFEHLMRQAELLASRLEAGRLEEILQVPVVGEVLVDSR